MDERASLSAVAARSTLGLVVWLDWTKRVELDGISPREELRMTSSRTRVVARLRAQPGEETELKSVLEGLIEPTRAEAGCLHYELWQNRADSSEFTFIEEWASDEALASHGESDHIRQGRERMRDLLAEPMDLRRYDRIR